MIGKSNSFRQITPFYPRPGILGDSYHAFPLDISGNPPIPYGCLRVISAVDFESTGEEGGPFNPLVKVYTIANVGGASIDWTLTASESWVGLSETSGTLAPNESVNVTITLDGDELGTFFVGTFSSDLVFTNTTNDCGNITLGVSAAITGEFPGQTIRFDQYDGPFEYPAWLPQREYRYYLNESIGGNWIARYAPVGGNVGARACNTTDPDVPAYGVVTATYGGSVGYNISNSSVTGSLTASVYQDGIIGAYDSGAGSTTNYSAGSVAGIINAVPPFAQNYSLSDTGTSVSQRWSTTKNETGWFPGSVGGPFDSIYCTGGSLSATASDPVTVEILGIPIARTGGAGSSAQTQTTGDFDTSTRINEGNFSRAVITVEVDTSRVNLTGTFTFLVTPTVGDPYYLTVIKDFPISVVSPVEGSVDFPLIPNATVFMESWTYSYQKVLAESFESYAEAIQITSLDSSPSWPNPIFFGAPVPNTNCWDDFESYPTEVIQDGITQIITGERFAAPAYFSNQSRDEFVDDFEGYAAGTISVFGQGIGFVGAGSSRAVEYGFFYDDFESYAAGSLFVFDFTSTDNLWIGDGHSA